MDVVRGNDCYRLDFFKFSRLFFIATKKSSLKKYRMEIGLPAVWLGMHARLSGCPLPPSFSGCPPKIRADRGRIEPPSCSDNLCVVDVRYRVIQH